MKARKGRRRQRTPRKYGWHAQLAQQQMDRIDDGFSTLYSFRDSPDGNLWEKEVTPPGMSAGGAVDTTTMRNVRNRTANPKKLITLTPSTFTAAYDTAFYVQARSMLGKNQPITVHFADGSKIIFWGWLDEFKPSGITEGNQPVAECTIIPSNQDDRHVEVDPVYIDAQGDTNDTNNS